MKKVWIYVLAIFMLVSALSFAGAATELDIGDQPFGDGLINISIPESVTITEGNDFNLTIEATGIKSTGGDFGIGFLILNETNYPVYANLSSFKTVIESTGISNPMVTVANQTVTPGNVYLIPGGISRAISAAVNFTVGSEEATIKVTFNGTVKENQEFKNAKVLVAIGNSDCIYDDVNVKFGGNLVSGEFKLVKAKMPDLNPTIDPTSNTTVQIPPSSNPTVNGTNLTIESPGITTVIHYDGLPFKDGDKYIGHVDSVDVIYENINGINNVLIDAVLELDGVPKEVPAINPVIDPSVVSTITNAVKDKNIVATLAMMTADSSEIQGDANLTNLHFAIYIPKGSLGLTEDNVRVYHVSGTTVKPVEYWNISDVAGADNYIIYLSSEDGFSSYAVAKVEDKTPVTPSGGGSSSGGSTWATTTPTPTVTPTPTGTPTDTAPTDVPTSGQPTKPAGSPVPILGILGGLVAAGLVLRRK